MNQENSNYGFSEAFQIDCPDDSGGSTGIRPPFSITGMLPVGCKRCRARVSGTAACDPPLTKDLNYCYNTTKPSPAENTPCPNSIPGCACNVNKVLLENFVCVVVF